MMRHKRTAVLLSLFWVLLYSFASAQDQIAVKFHVWPPETKILKPVPGGTQPVELGQAGEPITFSRSQDFNNGKTPLTLYFKAPGYESYTETVDMVSVENLASTGGFYPRQISLSPQGTWNQVTDFFRRYKIPTFVVLAILALAGLSYRKTFQLKRHRELHKRFGGDGNLTESSGYILFKPLGEGGTAMTWTCCKKEDFYALPLLGTPDPPRMSVFKEISKGFHIDTDEHTGFQKGFQREVNSLQQCTHPNIVPLEDFGVDSISKYSYIVMAKAQGESLDRYINRREKTSLEDVLKIAKQLSDGLDYMHGIGLYHRDIKPENVILSQDNKVTIIDLGIAKTNKDLDKLTKNQDTFIGSPYYQPQWQVAASDPHHSFDQYAVAVCLAELLIGEQPFELPAGQIPGPLNWIYFKVYVPLKKKRPDLPQSVDDFFRKYFEATRPNQVYGSMREFYQAFEAACQV